MAINIRTPLQNFNRILVGSFETYFKRLDWYDWLEKTD